MISWHSKKLLKNCKDDSFPTFIQQKNSSFTRKIARKRPFHYYYHYYEHLAVPFLFCLFGGGKSCRNPDVDYCKENVKISISFHVHFLSSTFFPLKRPPWILSTKLNVSFNVLWLSHFKRGNVVWQQWTNLNYEWRTKKTQLCLRPFSFGLLVNGYWGFPYPRAIPPPKLFPCVGRE